VNVCDPGFSVGVASPEPRCGCPLRTQLDAIREELRQLRRMVMRGEEVTHIRWEGRLPPPWRGAISDSSQESPKGLVPYL